MRNDVRYRARPDLHSAPLAGGAFFSSGDREITVDGWPGLLPAMQPALDRLQQGADVDELVASLGTERARAAVEKLLAVLHGHGMLIPLDRHAAEPSPAERDRYGELIAYLECHSTDPYGAFARIASTAVILEGRAEDMATARPLMAQLGLDPDQSPGAGPGPRGASITLRVLHDPEDLPPVSGPVLPVLLGDRVSIAGPVVDGEVARDRWRALVDRAQRPAGDAGGTAPVPSPGMAISLGVHLVLQHLGNVTGPDAHVVDECRSTTVAVRIPATPSGTEDPAGTTARESRAQWLRQLTAPVIGPHDSADDAELPQMPVAIRRARRAEGGLAVAGGPDQTSAAISLGLALSRGTRADGAAGTTGRGLRADGALRALPALATMAARPVVPGRGDGRDRHRLRSAIQVRSGNTVTSTAHRTHGVSWVLVEVAAGPLTGRAWAPTEAEAERRAMAQWLAHWAGDPAQCQPGACHRPAPCTDALADADETEVDRLLDDLDGWGRRNDWVLIVQADPDDPLLGRGPFSSGTVRWSRTGPPGSGAPEGVPGADLVLAAPAAPDLAPPDPAPDSTPDLAPPSPAPDPVAALRRAGVLGDVSEVPMGGWQPDTWSAAVQKSLTGGTTLLPVLRGAEALTLGPLWFPGSPAGCAGCAELRRRLVLDHVLAPDLHRAVSVPAVAVPPTVSSALGAYRGRPLEPGDLLAVTVDGVSRHRVARHPDCPWCGARDGTPAGVPLAPLRLEDAPVGPDPTRVAAGTVLLDEDRLDEVAVDPVYGPVRGILRESTVPLAMSMAVLAGGTVMGHGRGLSFRGTRSVAVLEAFERLAGFPGEAPLVLDTPYLDVVDEAVDPSSLGRYSATQLAHPTSKVTPYRPGEPIDWAVGLEPGTGRRRLVPAEIGFYQYDLRFKRDRRAAQASAPHQRRRCFLESSSGCAVGSTAAEAAVHALFEVAERDAFQLAWHAAAPLPQLPADQMRDPVVEELVELIASRGYDLHFLVATQDIDLPVIWVLATHRSGGFPATFSSAGSGADPVAAARSGLREVAQLVTMPLDWDERDARALVDDPWRVTELEHHVQYASDPRLLDRVAQVLGGPSVTPEEAFPGWPDLLRPSSGGILTVLGDVLDRFTAAGLDEVVLVDQSQREHRDLGISVVKAVVPGTVPMCFGQAHQRLTGIPRLDAVLDTVRAAGRSVRLDPHPFP
jgi:ribosomal protein S12 methylthiotransferase accessory factor